MGYDGRNILFYTVDYDGRKVMYSGLRWEKHSVQWAMMAETFCTDLLQGDDDLLIRTQTLKKTLF